MKKKIIKQQTVEQESIGKQPEKVVFGFSKLKALSYTEAKNDSDFFICFLDRLKKISDLDWNTIMTSQRHGFGKEFIEVSSLKISAQNLLSEDVKKLMVLRSKGDNHPFLGIREGNIFQVLFIEYQFGDIYTH